MCLQRSASTHESRLSLLLYPVSQWVQAVENCRFLRIPSKIHLGRRKVGFFTFSSLNKSGSSRLSNFFKH